MRSKESAMGLTKYKLGKLVEPVLIKCGMPQYENVSGINIYKKFMPSRNVGVDTSNYSIVPPGHFAFNLMHVGRDEKIPVALNDTPENIVVSGAYFVFKVISETTLIKEYLSIVMTSPAFDRYAWFCTDSSIRGNLDWGRFCDIEIDLPQRHIQQKYVDVYNAMEANQRVYERGLVDLKLTCDAYIERLRRDLPHTAIGDYIEQSDERNSIGLAQDSVRGIATSKELISTKADLEGVALSNYKVMRPYSIAYVADTSRRGDKISLAMNNTNETYLVSSISTIFNTNHKKLLPSYLMMFFSRTEFDRYSRYHSWGSARETFNWVDMQEVKIPIPELKMQQSIVDIYNAYLTRREINETLKTKIKDICPILIKGSLEEALSS
jgi:type I restriction enzyme, S subunit